MEVGNSPATGNDCKYHWMSEISHIMYKAGKRWKPGAIVCDATWTRIL